MATTATITNGMETMEVDVDAALEKSNANLGSSSVVAVDGVESGDVPDPSTQTKSVTPVPLPVPLPKKDKDKEKEKDGSNKKASLRKSIKGLLDTRKKVKDISGNKKVSKVLKSTHMKHFVNGDVENGRKKLLENGRNLFVGKRPKHFGLLENGRKPVVGKWPKFRPFSNKVPQNC